MDMYINDLSFQGQCDDYEKAMEAVNQLANTINITKVMRGHSPVKRTRELKYSLICPDKTIHDFLFWLYEEAKHSSICRDILTKVQVNLMQGPFLNLGELDESKDKLVAPCGELIKNSSIHAAISHECSSIPAVISAVNSVGFDKVAFTLDGYDKKIINLVSTECFTPYLRIYEPNPKHDIIVSKIVGGKVHTKMDLAPEEAKKILDNGICIEDKNIIFAYHNECWYQFPAHLKCKFHCFPIGKPTNDTNINRITKEVGQPPYPNNGYKIIS
jgi:hypothetical protein